ncbi:MAG: alpha/beta hydrolase [Candidatus Eremiobacteraeota bacterium]|nr:alpha/beta hydrolase [Candidatus Eremiobacteraeota bacterium]MBV9408215.1 alpha/beta hydrolase [Candidatus Eremiobacteraeota bacterium]
MTDALAFADTRDLRVAYVERGPRDGEPVLLYHGFPDDARTWDHLAGVLADAGYRTIVPYVRGFGPTRFADGAERTGETASVVADVVALADALGLARFHVVGHDWGGRAGYGAAILAPDRVRSLTAMAVIYGTNVASQAAMAVEQVRAYWYQWYFATPRGERELATNAHDFCRALWRWWSPDWQFSDAEYDATAASFANPDFVAVVLSAYRQRWGFAPGAAAYAAERKAIEAVPPIRVPTLLLLGRDDGTTLASSAAGKEALFTGPYDVQVVPDSGHFLHRERPDDVARRVLAHLRAYEGA